MDGTNRTRIVTRFAALPIAYRRADVGDEPRLRTIFQRGISSHNGRKFVLAPIPGGEEGETLEGVLNRQHFVLVVDVYGEGGLDEAFTSVRTDLQRILDQLSFRTLVPTEVISVEVVDTTPPITNGTVRRHQFYSGQVLDRGIRGAPVTAGDDLPFSELPDVGNLDVDAASAVAWFSKSLQTADSLDQFIDLWVCLEFLMNMARASVTEPTKCWSCHAQFAECPDCRASWVTRRTGRTVVEYLTTKGRLSEEIANRQWDMRQLLHGRHRFETSDFNQLPILVLNLRAALVNALQSELSLTDGQVPSLEGGSDIGPISLVLFAAVREVNLVPIEDFLKDEVLSRVNQ